jgi:hypothetical protein
MERNGPWSPSAPQGHQVGTSRRDTRIGRSPITRDEGRCGGSGQALRESLSPLRGHWGLYAETLVTGLLAWRQVYGGLRAVTHKTNVCCCRHLEAAGNSRQELGRCTEDASKVKTFRDALELFPEGCKNVLEAHDGLE